MANAVGTAVIDFGAVAGQYATVTVTGQTGLASTSFIDAWIMREDHADHSDYEHMLAPITLRCGNIVVNTSFVIHAIADFPLNGSFKVRWVWSD